MTYIHPKGIGLTYGHDKNCVIPKGGAAFVISEACGETTRSTTFTGHVQAAYDANIPILALANVNPGWYCDVVKSVTDPSTWPDAVTDPHVVNISRMIGNRIVHGVILNLTKVTDNYGHTITGTWFAAIGRHLTNLVYKTCLKPVYILAPLTGVINGLPDNKVAIQWLSTEGLGVGTNKASFLPSATDPQPIAWNQIPVPLANYVPDYCYAVTQAFVKYSSTKYQLPGIIGAPVGLWYFGGSLDVLHTELGFTPGTVIPSPEPPVIPSAEPPTSEPPVSDPADIVALKERLDALEDWKTVLTQKLHNL